MTGRDRCDEPPCRCACSCGVWSALRSAATEALPPLPPPSPVSCPYATVRTLFLEVNGPNRKISASVWSDICGSTSTCSERGWVHILHVQTRIYIQWGFCHVRVAANHRSCSPAATPSPEPNRTLSRIGTQRYSREYTQAPIRPASAGVHYMYLIEGSGYTPAINNGCTRSITISHALCCIVPTSCDCIT